nr:hypothetical protein CFP56_04604 [Quercus suber]
MRRRRESETAKIQDIGKVMTRDNTSSGSPSRATRHRPGRTKGKEREKRKMTDNVGQSRVDCSRQPCDVGSQNCRLFEEDAASSHDPEAFYRSPQKRDHMRRMEESPREYRPCEDDGGYHSIDGDQPSHTEPQSAVRETIDFSLWVRSPSVINAATALTNDQELDFTMNMG